MRYLVATVPGLSTIAARELKRAPGVDDVETLGSDGRTDLLGIEMAKGADPPSPRSAEDVFVALGEARNVRGLRDLLDRIWDEQTVARALSVYGAHVGALKTRMTFRVIARVRSEALFKRTELRDGLVGEIARIHPRWIHEDPAALEFWIAETTARTFELGLRLTIGSRSRRVVEREGALRPSVAGAMVMLAGEPTGVLFDPMCGTGTILAEAEHAGWLTLGGDLDVGVLFAARRNAGVPVVRADARLPALEKGSVDAVVSNLPFGKRFPIEKNFYAGFLAAMSTIVAPTGRVVVLAPAPFERALAKAPLLHLVDKAHIDLLGERTTVWSLFRDQRPAD